MAYAEKLHFEMNDAKRQIIKKNVKNVYKRRKTNNNYTEM